MKMMVFMDIYPLFKKIHFNEEDSLLNEIKCKEKKVFSIIRTGIELDMYRVGDICLTPWNELVVCCKLIVTRDATEAAQPTIYLLPNVRMDYYKKYGAYDYLRFSPICGMLVTKASDQSTVVYSDPAIIYNKMIYIYRSEFDKAIEHISETSYFSPDIRNQFDAVPVHYQNLKLAFSLNTSPILFTLISTGYVDILNNNNKLDLTFNYSDLDSVNKLRQFLVTSRIRMRY